MKKSYIYYIIWGINIIFPILFLPINLLLIFFSKNIENKLLKILLFNICYSFAIYSFLLDPTGNIGDVSNYALMYESAKEIDNWIILLNQLEYYSWAGLLKLSSYFNLNFQTISAFCVFLFYFCVFLNLMFFYSKIKNINAFKIVLIKILITVSILTISISYRNPLAFSIVTTGIILIELRKKIFGILITLVGIGFHYSTIIYFFIYLFSKFIQFKRKYLILSCLLFFITSPNSLQIISTYLEIPYLMNKIEYYTMGQWAERDYSTTSLILINFGIIFNMIFLVYCSFYIQNNKEINKNDLINNIANFLLLYLVFLIPLFFYRTILDRYSFSGGGFSLILFYYIIFSNQTFFRRNKFNIIIFIIWFSFIDHQLLFLLIGQFSFNFLDDNIILYSPINYFINFL